MATGYTSQYGPQSSDRCDLHELLSTFNHDVGRRTCTGYAPSCRRRCRKPVYATNINYICSKLATMNPRDIEADKLLREAAAGSLCYLHINQANSIAMAWKSNWTTDFDERKLRAEIRAATELLRRMFAEQQQYQRSSGSSQSNTNTNKEQTGRQSKPKTPGSTNQSTPPKPKTQPKPEPNQRQHPYATRSQTKPERQRTEREEWDHVWAEYLGRWEALDANPSKRDQVEIPWPTKSGKLQHVTPDNVRTFFRQAPPVQLSTVERCQVMNKENLKWHTDKLIGRFGDEVVRGPYKDTLDMITRTVVAMRQDLRHQKSEERV